jgi:hypothetical protein
MRFGISQHEGVTFKKPRASEQDRPDIARQRTVEARQARIDPRRLVFIDETWAKNFGGAPTAAAPNSTPRRQSALR